MKCKSCAKYPFCNKIEQPQQEACKNYIKRKLDFKIERIKKDERGRS